MKERTNKYLMSTVLVVTLLIIVFLISLQQVFAQQQNLSTVPMQNLTHNVTAYFFYGYGCPHCEQLMPVMKGFEQKYPQLKVMYLEVWSNETNSDIFANMSKSYSEVPRGVPTVFIGEDKSIIGYAEGKTNLQIEQRITNCIQIGCKNPEEILANFTNSAGDNQSKEVSFPIIILIVILILIVLLVLLTLIFRTGALGKNKKGE